MCSTHGGPDFVEKALCPGRRYWESDVLAGYHITRGLLRRCHPSETHLFLRSLKTGIRPSGIARVPKKHNMRLPLSCSLLADLIRRLQTSMFRSLMACHMVWRKYCRSSTSPRFGEGGDEIPTGDGASGGVRVAHVVLAYCRGCTRWRWWLRKVEPALSPPLISGWTPSVK